MGNHTWRILSHLRGRNVEKMSIIVLIFKGQMKTKADWRAVDFSEKWRNKFVLFAFLLFTANKTNLFVNLLGESTARPKFFWFYLTFTKMEISSNFFASSENFNFKLLLERTVCDSWLVKFLPVFVFIEVFKAVAKMVVYSSFRL